MGSPKAKIQNPICFQMMKTRTSHIDAVSKFVQWVYLLFGFQCFMGELTECIKAASECSLLAEISELNVMQRLAKLNISIPAPISFNSFTFKHSIFPEKIIPMMWQRSSAPR